MKNIPVEIGRSYFGLLDGSSKIVSAASEIIVSIMEIVLSRLAQVFFGSIALMSFASEASAFTASFRWCSGSPAFSLNAIPKGTVKLELQMTDLNVPGFNHGGGKVVYSGKNSIPCDAFTGTFSGPAPPPPQVHTYEFEIKALGAGGETLGKTTARRKFPE